MLQACEAIAEAHAVGVIHRDIKPSNLFLVKKRDGTSLVKVLDFGISKLVQTGSDAAQTRTAALMGSPLYMSPEQMASSRDVDARSDIWALGVVLYEALTGATPFEGETLPQICLAVASADPSPIGQRVPGLPPGLGATVMRCLEKSPAARFSSVANLAAALSPFAPSARGSLERITHSLMGSAATVLDTRPDRRPQPPAAGVSSPSGTEAAWGETRMTPARRVPLWPIGIALAAAGTLAALWLLGRATPPDETTQYEETLGHAAPTAPALAARPAEASSLASASADAAPPAPSAAPRAVAPAPAATSTAAVTPPVTAVPAARSTARTPRPRVSRPERPPLAASPKPEPPAPGPTAEPRAAPTDLGKPGSRSRL